MPIRENQGFTCEEIMLAAVLLPLCALIAVCIYVHRKHEDEKLERPGEQHALVAQASPQDSASKNGAPPSDTSPSQTNARSIDASNTDVQASSSTSDSSEEPADTAEAPSLPDDSPVTPPASNPSVPVAVPQAAGAGDARSVVSTSVAAGQSTLAAAHGGYGAATADAQRHRKADVPLKLSTAALQLTSFSGPGGRFLEEVSSATGKQLSCIGNPKSSGECGCPDGYVDTPGYRVVDASSISRDSVIQTHFCFEH